MSKIILWGRLQRRRLATSRHRAVVSVCRTGVLKPAPPASKEALLRRVSMDLITVDITDLPPDAVQPGRFATLIGPGHSIEDAGYAAGTIGYEILTRLGPRFARLYLDDAGA